MGCSASKLDEEEAVQLCKDRKNLIKQAVEQRIRFATGHTAYVLSLRRVSLALRNYIEGDDHHDFFSDSCSTPPFTPVKRLSPDVISIPLKPPLPKPIQSEKGTSHVVHYLRSGGNPSISVEERPQSPETIRINSYHAPVDQYGMDGYFGMQSSPMNTATTSYFSSSPYHNRPSYPPPSPQNSQWDFFWNPFSSLETSGYPPRNSHDHITSEDEIAGLRRVREEEGIPDLEDEDEEEEEEEELPRPERVDHRPNVDMNFVREAYGRDQQPAKANTGTDTVHQVKEFQSHAAETASVSESQNNVELKLHNDKEIVRDKEAAEGTTPGFTVYVNRRPASMSEVMREIDHQFMRICDSAHEVSVMLEASRAQYSSASSEPTAIKMLNPIALFRSGSSRSSSSRFLQPSSCSRDDYETSSEFSEESCMLSGSHQSTLDRLYAWEKKLYDEVKSGERIRITYEKKCMQLRSQDENGEDPSSVDKTRRAVRDLHTGIKVSIHSIEAISMRIEKLRDEELHPQLMELIQGLSRMWRTMADCHRIQKLAIDEAKLLLATPKLSEPPPPLIRLGRSATNLESELRNWRSCLSAWITSQRSYIHALAGWLIRCAPPDPSGRPMKSPLSPPRSSGAPPIFGICTQWSGLLDSVSEAHTVEGLDFFAAGIASVVAQQREEEAMASRRKDDDVERGSGMTPEKMAEVAVRVVCAGMSVAVSSLAEFAVCSMDGCDELLKAGRE